MRGDDHRTDPYLDEKARFRAPVWKTLIWATTAAVTLTTGAFGVGAGYQQYAHKLASIESRMKDMPTREDMTKLRTDYENRMRYMLERASWWCPPTIKKQPATWSLCRASFETYPAPPKGRRESDSNPQE